MMGRRPRLLPYAQIETFEAPDLTTLKKFMNEWMEVKRCRITGLYFRQLKTKDPNPGWIGIIKYDKEPRSGA